jgi:hypothetical protein
MCERGVDIVVKMRPLILLLLFSIGISLLLCEAQEPTSRVQVRGVIRGYFLGKDRTLSVHEVPFSYPAPEASAPPGKGLLPLWAGYSFKMEVESPTLNLKQVVIKSGNGTVLWKTRPADPAVTKVTIPHYADKWVGLHVRQGLRLSVIVTLTDGHEERFSIAPPRVRVDQVQTLKIDWLDLVRIYDVRAFLRAHGDDIWRGFRADNVPFLLQGDEGQWVLIDHPKPPSSFRRYSGPLPVPMKVWVGKPSYHPPLDASMADGWMDNIGGVFTACLPYKPYWWALAGKARNEHDALDRLLTVLHEAFHVFCQRYLSASVTYEIPFPTHIYRAWQDLEDEALKNALQATASTLKEQVERFLVMRDLRRHAFKLADREIKEEQKHETGEAVTHWVTRRALVVARQKKWKGLLSKVDPFFRGYPDELEDSDLLPAEDEEQIIALLERLNADWQAAVRRGITCEELLAQSVSYSFVAAQKKFSDDIRVAHQKVTDVSAKARRQADDILKTEGLRLWVILELETKRGQNFDPKDTLIGEDEHEETIGEARIAINRPTVQFFVPNPPGKYLACGGTVLKESSSSIRFRKDGDVLQVEVEEVIRQPDGIVHTGRKEVMLNILSGRLFRGKGALYVWGSPFPLTRPAGTPLSSASPPLRDILQISEVTEVAVTNQWTIIGER